MAIALLSHALLDKEEVLLELDVAVAEMAKTDLVNLLINRVTVTLEHYLDRRIVARGSGSPMTEYHTMHNVPLAVSELYLLEWPVQLITSVHEDNTRAYAAASLLVKDTDYVVNNRTGKLTRIAGSDQPTTAWNRSYREQKVIYDGGYANVAAVPDDLREVAAELVVLRFREIVSKQHGLSGVINDVGNIQRFGAAALSREMMAALEPHRRREPTRTRTGERDS